MPPSEIPTDHHFARLVGGSKIVNNEDGSGREALTPDAFRMRPDEDALSGSYFENAGSNEQQCAGAISIEWRSQNLRIGQSRMALAESEAIRQTGNEHQRKLRVLHEGVPAQPSYAQIRGIREDDSLLLDALARSCVTKLLACI
jgi:hypothetical protein